MKKTSYKILKMDCASEEQLIRMKLEENENITHLDFNIPDRMLHVYHKGDAATITEALDTLRLGSNVEGTIDDAVLPIKGDEPSQRRLLWQVLIINFVLFVIEITTGFISHSMGLVADSLDMLADALVYSLALFAVGGTALRKGRVAKFSGFLQLALAIAGFVEVLRRFMGHGAFPIFKTMIFISLLALIGNAASLYLLVKSKSKESHMQASLIFTSNDVIVNIGVILAGVLVYITSSRMPDLIVGVVVFAIVARGALKILRLQ